MSSALVFTPLRISLVISCKSSLVQKDLILLSMSATFLPTSEMALRRSSEEAILLLGGPGDEQGDAGRFLGRKEGEALPLASTFVTILFIDVFLLLSPSVQAFAKSTLPRSTAPEVVLF